MTAEEQQKIVTVSDIFWYPIKDGKCPQCGRYRKLGMVNDGDVKNQFNDRCVDCCFGPPMEYWDSCEDCGQLYVGEHCDNPKCQGHSG